jgi:hypothetical protein
MRIYVAGPNCDSVDEEPQARAALVGETGRCHPTFDGIVDLGHRCTAAASDDLLQGDADLIIAA